MGVRMQRLAQAAALARDDGASLVDVSGSVTHVSRSAIALEGLAPFVALGDRIELRQQGCNVLADVVRIESGVVLVKPYAEAQRIGLGARGHWLGAPRLAPTPQWKGRILNGLGVAIDDLGPLPQAAVSRPLAGAPPAALSRGRLVKGVRTGVRAVDLFTPLCIGQRVGIFAGSGVGKSTLLAMLARARGFDSIVVALVGERGREVREFIDDHLGQERSRTIVVVATGDESAMQRRVAPLTAMTIAEALRDAGESVLIVVDSITRFAHAAREVGLAAGEPPVARGYPPSVFGDLPALLERAGPGAGQGAITAFFSVLVDGDDFNDPIADAVRGTLDGHIVLSRTLADRARYPAIDPLASLSRVADRVWTSDQRILVGRLREVLARYEETHDLRAIGAYQPGSDAFLDKTVLLAPRIHTALRQAADAPASTDAFRELSEMIQDAG